MSQQIRTRRLLCTSTVGFRYTNSHGRNVLCICKFALCLIRHQATSKADWKCICTQFNLSPILVDTRGQLHETSALHPRNELHIHIGGWGNPRASSKEVQKKLFDAVWNQALNPRSSRFLRSFAEFQIYNQRILWV
jgi:hypothetical protein